MLIVADRLKITLTQLLDMPEAEYNIWLGYLMHEQEEHNRKSNLR
jgi:hypothetical protein